jgi:4,5-dihydroxyphthalate decarboxylase
MALRLKLACGRYDRTLPLLDGRISPDGVAFDPVVLPPWELFRAQLEEAPFDVAEFSMAHLAMLASRGDERFVGIPAFTSRAFRHSAIYVSQRSGISTPEDLRGGRIGVPDYTITAAVYVRGFLLHDFGIAPESMEWCWGGLETPSHEPVRIPFDLPTGLRLRHVGDDTLSRMLVDGDLDALLSAAVPVPFANGDGRVVRLFPDYRVREEDYFRRTGIRPIMHGVVLRRALAMEHPRLARGIFEAFSAAKAVAYQDLANLSALTTSLVWLPAALDAERSIFGADHWPYGVGANRPTIEAMLEFLGEQGLLTRPVAVDDLFLPDLLDT